MRYWRITYLPSDVDVGCVEWVFRGSESDLNEYLNEYHACNCTDCRDKDWWDTPQSAEYYIEEITEEYE